MTDATDGPRREGAGPPDFVHRPGDYLPEVAEIDDWMGAGGEPGLSAQVGRVGFRLKGLDQAQLESAREVFGGFTSDEVSGDPDREIEVAFAPADRDTFLAFRTTRPAERYRILVTRHGEDYRFVSYHFAAHYRPRQRSCRVALALGPGRREERLIDNLFRVLAGYAFIEEEMVLVHAAALARGDRGFLFLGPSGSGKTTVSRLSLGGAVPTDLLSDDQGLVSVREDGVFLSGTPFRGGERIHSDRHPGAIAGRNVNRTVPLVGLFRLVQSERVETEGISVSRQITDLLSAVPVFAGDPYNNERLVGTLEEIVARVPLKRLHFREDDSFWAVVDP
jgi:hypothetical protein